MNYTIRKATIDDACALAQILSESWASAYKDIIPAAELARQCDLSNNFSMFRTMLRAPRGEFYIALDGAIPCGEYMFCRSRDEDLPDYAEIVSIYTIERYWGGGLGCAMMKTALNNIVKFGFSHVFLWVFKENARARKFYEKFGFALDGAEKSSRFTNNAAEVRYTLSLAQGGKCL